MQTTRVADSRVPDEDIRVRAYFISLSRGGHSADPLQDWLEAERSLKAQPPAAVKRRVVRSRSRTA